MREIIMFIVKSIIVYGDVKITKHDVIKVFSAKERNEIYDIIREYDLMESENDFLGDGSASLYGSWSYPYEIFRSSIAPYEELFEERTGIKIKIYN